MATITWHGHGCFTLVTGDGTRILFDPFLADNPVAEIGPDDIEEIPTETWSVTYEGVIPETEERLGRMLGPAAHGAGFATGSRALCGQRIAEFTRRSCPRAAATRCPCPPAAI